MTAFIAPAGEDWLPLAGARDCDAAGAPSTTTEPLSGVAVALIWTFSRLFSHDDIGPESLRRMLNAAMV